MKNLIKQKIKDYKELDQDTLVLKIIQSFLIKTLLENKGDDFVFKIDKEKKNCSLISTTNKKEEIVYLLEYKNQKELEEIEIDSRKYSNFANTYYYSKIIMNVDLILNNPEYIALYLDEPDEFRLKSPKQLFKKYGIFIKTLNKPLSADERLSSELAFISCFKELGRIDDIFETKALFADLKNTIGIQTQSKRGGVQNVRDIYPLTKKEKQTQIKDIIKTLKKELDKPKEIGSSYQWFTEKGKEKDFNFIANETYVKKFKKNTDKIFYLITTNGGLIDGQNSVDSLLNIYNGMLDIKDNEFKDYRTLKFVKDFLIQTFELTKDGIVNEKKVKEIIDFLENSHIGINPTKAINFKIAVDTADSKNASIQVDKESLDVSKYIVEAIEMSKFAYKSSDYNEKTNNFEYEDLNININYPKKRREFYDNSNLIEFQELAAIYSNYKYIIEKENDIDLNNIARDMSKLRSFTKPIKKDDFILNFVKDFIDEENNSDEIKSIQSEIKVLNKVAGNSLSMLDLDDEFEFNDLEDLYEVVKEMQNLEIVRKLYNMLIEDHKKLKISKKEVQQKNKKTIALKNTDLYYSILKLLKTLDRKTIEIDTKELYRLNYTAYIFIILIVKIKKGIIKDLESFVNDINFEENLDNQINLFESKLKEIKSIYKVSLINEIFHRTTEKVFHPKEQIDDYKSFNNQLSLIKEFFNDDIESLKIKK